MTMASKFEIARFDGTGNFGLWQTRVKDLLVIQGISGALNEKKPARVEDDKWEEMQAQACAIIRLCLSDQIMYYIMDVASAKEIWDNLEEKFMPKTLARKLYLKQKLYGLKMREESDLAEHINVFNQLIADLLEVDVKIEDEDRAIIVLCSLPKSYEPLVTTLTYGKEKVNVDEIIAALLAHEQRRKNNSSGELSGSAFTIRGDHSGEDKKGDKKKRGPQCCKCKGWGHKKTQCSELKKSGGTASVVVTRKDDSDSDCGDSLIVSSKCTGWGHKKAQCSELKKIGGTASVVIARKDDSDSDCGDNLIVSSKKSCEAWWLESAPFHATPNKEWLLSYIDDDGGFSHLGDDLDYHIMGVGDIKFKMYDGQEVLLKGVKHVPGLRRNLISLGILHEEGWLYQGAPDKKTLRVMHGGKTVMIGEKSSAHQYKLKGSVVEGGVMDDNAICGGVLSGRLTSWQRLCQAVSKGRRLNSGT
ncbi:unnamed protein product [Urochloa humidicola]